MALLESAIAKVRCKTLLRMLRIAYFRDPIANATFPSDSPCPALPRLRVIQQELQVLRGKKALAGDVQMLSTGRASHTSSSCCAYLEAFEAFSATRNYEPHTADLRKVGSKNVDGSKVVGIGSN